MRVRLAHTLKRIQEHRPKAADGDDKDQAAKKYELDQTDMQTNIQLSDTVVKPQTGQVATNQTYIQNWTTGMSYLSQVQQYLSGHLSIK